MKKPYYVGLDCGTSSVGWAATDENYNLLRTNGKNEWGSRLFEEANTAAERRIFRSNRRRLARAKNRLKLLRNLFREEMLNVDPEFYQRLHESFFYEEDKNLKNLSRNTLFNDKEFTDKKFHDLYPTIWHLRKALIHADSNEHFDLRLYFLAIQHIFKHRGHFLIEGKFSQSGSDFQRIYDEFYDVAKDYGYILNDSAANKLEKIICDKTMGRQDKKKAIKELLWTDETDLNEDNSIDLLSLAGLLAGSTVDLAKIFGLEDSYKFSFYNTNFEERVPEIEKEIGVDNMDLIFAAKKIYDFGILHNLLGEHEFISDAMVANYEQHRKDLADLKKIFRPHTDIYKKLFRNEEYNEKFYSYAAYIRKSYIEKGGRRQTKGVSQADFNKQLEKLLEEVGYTGELLDRAKNEELLPKQRGQAKGTIPQQIHHQELEMILEKLGQDYPSFARENPKEKSEYNTKLKKIARIHDFRIPYYCGPLVKRKFDKDGNLIKGGKSEYSWADKEIDEIVYPWNFDELVDKDERADNFIRRMTNECKYLNGEEVLPKASLSYQKYMVLNELNNLKLDGRRIENELKQKIYEEGYLTGELKGNITLNKLSKWVHESFPETRGLELSGTSETKFLPKLSTYDDFKRSLGKDFLHKYGTSKLDTVVEAITILGDEKMMLQRKIAKILNLGEDSDVAKSLAKLNYRDWGKFSDKFLNGMRAEVDGYEMTILEALWETNKNLMELLSGEYKFRDKIDEINDLKLAKGQKITYQDVNALYCSPAVKRSIWQTIKILKELERVNHGAPSKIFIEVTRYDVERDKRGYTASRKKKLEQQLKAINTPDAKAILAQLEGKTDRELQSKKLFLYFSQMGKCAYCGKPINLDELNNYQLYDIDHIYPRSLTKDDSITRNLVLVHAEENRDKTNVYPVSSDIRNKMAGTWLAWKKAGLITEEKYDRLTRATPLTADELGGFIARQIIETSQGVLAIRELIKRMYPNTKVILVKAGQVSNFRHLMGYDKKDKEGNVKEKGRPEFIKVRELNDFHHAKDAYLNIVVGNVMNGTFTDDPRKWVRERDNQNYTISPRRLFRDSLEYEKEQDGKKVTTKWPFVKNWNFAESIKIINEVMKNNDVLWTRMNYVESSELSDLQLVGKSDITDGIMPIKQSKRYDSRKYGGYNSIKGAHFALIEMSKKGRVERKIIFIPQTVGQGMNTKSSVYLKRVDKYINEKYPEAKVIVPIIKYKACLEVNGVPLFIVGRTGNRITFQHGYQLVLPDSVNLDLKRICKVVQKDVISRGKYEIDEDKDGVNDEKVDNIFSKIMETMPLYKKIPSMETMIEKIIENKYKFKDLNLIEKCKEITELLKMTSCGPIKGNLSGFVPSASMAGTIMFNSNLDKFGSFRLINQSVTGLLERKIDLKTVKPKDIKDN